MSRCDWLVGFEGVLAGLCDPEADNFGRLGASHSLAFCGRKPDADEVGNHVAIEAMDPHKQCLGSATRANGEQIEQLQRAAGMRAEAAVSNGRHTFSVGPSYLRSINAKRRP
jgi:hypothetical protein